VVNVSLGISAVNLMENATSTRVCVILSAAEYTEREFSVNLRTRAGTAIGNYTELKILYGIVSLVNSGCIV